MSVPRWPSPDAIREHRAALGLETKLVIRNPDGDDQYPEEVALVVLDLIESGEVYQTALGEGIAQGRAAALGEATAAIKAADDCEHVIGGDCIDRDEALAALAALATPQGGGE